jgi:polar amino acid transport system substrate-binding protein
MVAVLAGRQLRHTSAALAVAGVIALAGCGGSGDNGGSSASASQPAPTKLVHSGDFTVCTDPTYPPLESFDQNQEYTGFDVDAAKAVAQLWGLNPSFQQTAFSGILPAMDAGRCDVAWSGLFIDPERTKSFAAVPYQKTASVIMVKAGNPAGIHSPDDLSGKTVTSQNGSDLLKKAHTISDQLQAEGKPASNVQGYDKFDEAIQQLAVGRADAVITQDIDAAARAKSQPGQFEIAYTFPDAETFGAYYQPTNTDLGDKLYKALKSLEESGQLKTIAEQNTMPVNGIAVGPPIGQQ